MWLIADFEAVTLFSLKMSTATASGGKTLLALTPYAIKMALLDVACRNLGVEKAEERWDGIRDLKIALYPARRAVVTNLFQKVLRPLGVINNAFLFEIQEFLDPQYQSIREIDFAFHNGIHRADAVQAQGRGLDMFRVAFWNAIDQRFVIGARRKRHAHAPTARVGSRGSIWIASEFCFALSRRTRACESSRNAASRSILTW